MSVSEIAFNRWHERRLEKRAAAKAIFADLYWARGFLEESLEDEVWTQISSPRTPDWIQYRDALSSGMRGRAFHRVAGAYHELQVLNLSKARGEPFDAERTKDALDRFERAEELLEKESLSRFDRLWMKLRGQGLTAEGLGSEEGRDDNAPGTEEVERNDAHRS